MRRPRVKTDGISVFLNGWRASAYMHKKTKEDRRRNIVTCRDDAGVKTQFRGIEQIPFVELDAVVSACQFLGMEEHWYSGMQVTHMNRWQRRSLSLDR